MIEMGEELRFAGLRDYAPPITTLIQADVLIASDGRRRRRQPTRSCARGGYPIDLIVALREGAHHSGNWGGLIAIRRSCWRRPLAYITDGRGHDPRAGWRPPLPHRWRDVLAGVEVDGGEDGPNIDATGASRGSSGERVFGWKQL